VEDLAILSQEHARHQDGHRDAAGGQVLGPAVHGDVQYTSGPVRARRADGQLLARLRRRAGASVHRVAAVRRRGPVPDQQHEAVVAGSVQDHPAAAVQVRRRGPGRRRRRRRARRAVLPARHRGDPHAQRPEHRPGVGAGTAGRPRPHHGRLHQVHARGLRAPARRAGQPGPGGAGQAEPAAAAAADPPRAQPPVHERAGDTAGGGGGGVRGCGAGPAARRDRGRAGAGGELVRRAAGRARRGADQLGVPAAGRGARPGGAVREDGCHRDAGVRPAGEGDGAQVPRLRGERGGEHAAGDAGAGAPGDQGPGLHPPQRVGQDDRVLPQYAGRAHRRRPLRARPHPSVRPPTPAIITHRSVGGLTAMHYIGTTISMAYICGRPHLDTSTRSRSSLKKKML
jgi:hypothetical protein